MSLSWGATGIIIEGHRGARARYPENTMPAFRYAKQAGADVLELDLAVTKDNVLVVSHDATINPSICTGGPTGLVIHSLTYAELQKYDCGKLKNPRFPNQIPVPGTKIPTLDEVLKLAHSSKIRFNIEIKSSPSNPEWSPAPDEFAQLVFLAIQKHGLADRVVVQSFDFRTLHAMKKIAPQIQLSALYAGPPRSFVSIAQEAGAQIVSPEHRLVTPEEVAEAHQAGIKVVAWTPNTPAEWEKLVQAKVDGIITDDPEALRQYLRARRLR